MKALLDQVLNKVADKQATGDLILSTSKSLKLSAHNGAISEYKVSSSQILGIRIIKNDRVGISYTESLDEESLSTMINQALSNAEFSEVNKAEKIVSTGVTETDELVESEAEIDIQFKIAKALELEQAPKNLDKRVIAVPYNSLSEDETVTMYSNSNGRYLHKKRKQYSIVSSALMEEANSKANFYHYQLSRTFAALNSMSVASFSVNHSRDLLAEQVLPTGRYFVKLRPDVLHSLFECFGNLFSAKSAIDKVNPWGQEIGNKLISSDLSIIDDARLAAAFERNHFDSEGIERSKLSLIEDGVLRNFYHNSSTASYFNTTSTGHASRGPSSSLNVSGTNLIVSGKNYKPMPPKYLEIIQMDGLYSGANRVTGDFSAAIKGYVWENNKSTMTFGNITLSGNIIDMLNQVEVVGEDFEISTDQSFFTVPLVFEGLSIAGR